MDFQATTESMKRLLTIILLAIPAFAVADTYNYLTLTSTSAEQSIALKTVRKITFEGADIVVTTADGTTTSMPLANFSQFAFTSTATGIQSVARPAADLCIEAGRIVADGQGLLLIYNANGQVVRQQYVSGNRSEVQLYDLPRGLYIARLGNRTLKVIR